jgi:hypothetical protein
MFPTLVLAAAMAFGPAQERTGLSSNQLNLTNVRVTFGGQFGPTRPDTRYLPGDLFFMVFDIEGLRSDAQGKVQYSIGMIVTDSNGKISFENKPEARENVIPLGASKWPAMANVIIGPDMKGVYTCSVTVTDRVTNETKRIERNFEVGEPSFGIVAFRMTYDLDDSVPAPLHGVPGQTLVMQFMTIGFARDSMKQPNNQVEVRILDSTGRPTTEQPQTFFVNKGIKDDTPLIEWKLPLPLSRPGSFTVELKATDLISNKSYKMRFPVSVYKTND